MEIFYALVRTTISLTITLVISYQRLEFLLLITVKSGITLKIVHSSNQLMGIIALVWISEYYHLKVLLQISTPESCGPFISNTKEETGILRQMHGDNGNGVEINP